MEKITRIQFWKLQAAMKNNRHLRLVSDDIRFSADPWGQRYTGRNGRVYARHGKDGYFADKCLLPLIDL